MPLETTLTDITARLRHGRFQAAPQTAIALQSLSEPFDRVTDCRAMYASVPGAQLPAGAPSHVSPAPARHRSHSALRGAQTGRVAPSSNWVHAAITRSRVHWSCPGNADRKWLWEAMGRGGRAGGYRLFLRS